MPTLRSYVTVLGPPERVRMVEEVFDCNRVPVKETLPVPSLVSLPGILDARPVTRSCYWLDLDVVTDEQRERLFQYAMRTFGMSRKLCEQEWDLGFPILAEETVFGTSARDFL